MKIFDNKNPKAISEWDKINNAILSGGGKKKLTTEDVKRIDEVVPSHHPERFSDAATTRATPKKILEANGGTHWQRLGEYQIIDKGIHKWDIEEGGDRNSIYWPYIPNDKELMEEIYRDRPGAKKMVNEHKKNMGWEISEQTGKQFHRHEGF